MEGRRHVLPLAESAHRIVARRLGHLAEDSLGLLTAVEVAPLLGRLTEGRRDDGQQNEEQDARQNFASTVPRPTNSPRALVPGG
jgi:hypothetical protein